MTGLTRKRTITVGTALALTATALIGSQGASVAGEGTICTPTTRTIDTLTYATPIALSPRGHVVADEASPGAGSALWLHRPNGIKTIITFGDGSRPEWPSDVSAHGLTVGTDGVNFTPIEPVLAWASQGGDAAFLSMPARVNLPSYMAQSVNDSGAIAGVATNYRDSSPGKTDFIASPIIWPAPDADPQDLPLPAGALAVAFDNKKPLISIRGDGLVSAVLDDYNGGGSYLARWRPESASPTLVQLPAIGEPVSVAGRWVVARPAADAVTGVGPMTVWSPTSQISLTDPLGRFGTMAVTANGTYVGTITVPGLAGSSRMYSIVGRGSTQPRNVSANGLAVDVAGTADGLVLVNTPTTTGIVSCALNLPLASDVVVSGAAAAPSPG